MNNLEPIEMSSVMFNIHGFQRYVNATVRLVVYDDYGTNDDNTSSENDEAYLKKDGGLLILIFSISGEKLGEIHFLSDEFLTITSD